MPAAEQLRAIATEARAGRPYPPGELADRLDALAARVDAATRESMLVERLAAAIAATGYDAALGPGLPEKKPGRLRWRAWVEPLGQRNGAETDWHPSPLAAWHELAAKVISLLESEQDAPGREALQLALRLSEPAPSLPAETPTPAPPATDEALRIQGAEAEQLRCRRELSAALGGEDAVGAEEPRAWEELLDLVSIHREAGYNLMASGLGPKLARLHVATEAWRMLCRAVPRPQPRLCVEPTSLCWYVEIEGRALRAHDNLADAIQGALQLIALALRERAIGPTEDLAERTKLVAELCRLSAEIPAAPGEG